MRLAIAAVLLGFLGTANASPFGESRSDVSDESGTSSVKLSMKKKKGLKKDDVGVVDDDKPAKPAKKAKKAKKADSETIVIVDDEPAKPAKKAKKAKKAEEPVAEVIIIDDTPAKPAKKAKKAKK